MKSTSLISYLKFNGINMNGKLFTDALRNKSNANLTCYYFLQIVCKLLLLDLIFRNFSYPYLKSCGEKTFQEGPKQ